MDIQQALARLVEREDLSREEMAGVMRQVMSGEATEAQIGALLVALRMKGETAEEIAGCVNSLRKHAVPVPLDGIEVFDCCGISIVAVKIEIQGI